MTLLEALKKIRDEGPANIKLGICYSLDFLIEEASDVFYSLIREWPQFSGNIMYPVSGSKTYREHSRKGTLWQGEQLDLRMSLINFCIKELENETTRT